MADNASALVRDYEAAEQASQEARSESGRARDYYDGRQLTADQIKTLKKRKQPIVIENLIRPKVDYLCGLERQTRTDPKAYPRTATHEDDANAATDALRYVADDEDLDIKRSGTFQNMLVEGYGGIEIGHKEVRGEIDPKLTLIEWDRLFFDPHSSKPDFSDAEYTGYVTWLDLAKAKKRWPDSEAVLDATLGKGTSDLLDTYEDKPRWANWSDTRRRRVRIVTIYKLVEDVWHRSVFTLSGELEPLAPSPYIDENGKPENPLILQSAYVDRDNDRYGLVRDFMTLQDEVNKRRSKFLHLSNSRQVRVGLSYTGRVEDVRKELSRPDGVIIGEQGDVEIISTGDMAAGHFNLLAEAKQAIQAVGPNATMQGKASQDSSGRAIMALQQGGMTEIAPLLDGLRHLNIRIYRAMWNRIRQFWTAERWVRVTDDQKNVRFVGMNTTQGSMAAFKVRDALKAGKIDETQARQFAMQIQSDPAMMQPANVIADLDVDIQIDEVANAPSLQLEQFDQLAKLAPMAPQPFIPTLFEMLVEASSLRNKDKLREIMEQAKAPPQPDPMQQAMQQLQIAGAEAEVNKTKSEATRNMAQAEATQADSITSAYQACYGAG